MKEKKTQKKPYTTRTFLTHNLHSIKKTHIINNYSFSFYCVQNSLGVRCLHPYQKDVVSNPTLTKNVYDLVSSVMTYLIELYIDINKYGRKNRSQ